MTMISIWYHVCRKEMTCEKRLVHEKIKPEKRAAGSKTAPTTCL
jgi:hypothetical protein